MTESSLVWTSPPEVIAAAVVLGLLVMLLALRRPGADRRALELGLLLPAVVAVVVAAAGPLQVTEGKRLEEGRLVVLVDDSRSMSVLESGRARSARVQEALDALGEQAVVERFTFAGSLKAGADASFEKSDTDLAAALGAVADR